jgi:hypothetical protein
MEAMSGLLVESHAGHRSQGWPLLVVRVPWALCTLLSTLLDEFIARSGLAIRLPNSSRRYG